MTDSFETYRETVKKIAAVREKQLAEALAEITRLLAASEWRDISTAPRDGTIVDLWSGIRFPDCRWESSSYAHDIPWGWGNSSFGRILNATHWMPLPAPPQRNEVKQ